MENLDSETINKINTLAESLKEKHLAANMDDAMIMAKEIILKSDPVQPSISESIGKAEEIENHINELVDKIEHEVQEVSKIKVDAPYQEIEKKINQIGTESEKPPITQKDVTDVQEKPKDIEDQMTANQVANIIKANPNAVDLIMKTPEVFIEKTKTSAALIKLFEHVNINDVIAEINPSWKPTK